MPGHRPKGLPKTGGRKKGTPNKRTQAQEELQELLMPYLTGEGLASHAGKMKLADDLQAMTPVDRCRAIASYMPYMMPKLATLEAKVNIETKTYEEELDEMMQE